MEALQENITEIQTENADEALALKKEQIIELATNVKQQFVTFSEICKTRIEQLMALDHIAKELSMQDMIPDKTIEDAGVSMHGIIVNMDEIDVLINKVENMKTPLYDKYEKYLQLLECVNAGETIPEGIDMDIEEAELQDLMQPYLRDTTDISNKIDILTETYTVEVQVPIERILNNLANADRHVEKLIEELEQLKDKAENEDGTKQ